MKSQDIQKLRQLSPLQLQTKLQSLQPEATKMRLSLKASKEKNLHSARKIRQQIAIIKTILSQQP